MLKYPVKPDTAVQLPIRSEGTAARKAPNRRKPVLSEQEQIRRLKLRLRRLWAAFVLVLLLLAGLSWFTVRQISANRKPPPGQNYTATTSKSTEPSE